MRDMEAAFKSAFSSLLEPLPPHRAKAFLDRVSYRKVEAGQVLLREGQTCPMIPFVVSGCLRVYKTAESGREITLYRIEEGQSCIISSGCVEELASFPANVIAERAGTVAFMPAALAKEFFDGIPAFRDFVLGQFAARMADIMELVEEVAFRRVDERLKDWLLREASDSKVSATHREIADHLGTSREVVSRILKDWELRGYLSLARGEIELAPRFKDLNVSA
jgi:CRP/FNR family transcriptional regulator